MTSPRMRQDGVRRDVSTFHVLKFKRSRTQQPRGLELLRKVDFFDKFLVQLESAELCSGTAQSQLRAKLRPLRVKA